MNGMKEQQEYLFKEFLKTKPAPSHAFGGGVDSMCLAVNSLEGINNLSTLQERYILASFLRTLPNKIRTIEDFMRGQGGLKDRMRVKNFYLTPTLSSEGEGAELTLALEGRGKNFLMNEVNLEIRVRVMNIYITPALQASIRKEV